MSLPIQYVKHHAISLLVVQNQQQVCCNEIESLAVAHLRKSSCQNIQHSSQSFLQLTFSFIGGDGSIDISIYLFELLFYNYFFVLFQRRSNQLHPDLRSKLIRNSFPNFNSQQLLCLLEINILFDDILPEINSFLNSFRVIKIILNCKSGCIGAKPIAIIKLLFFCLHLSRFSRSVMYINNLLLYQGINKLYQCFAFILQTRTRVVQFNIIMSRPEIFSFISNQKLSWILQLMSCFFWVSSFIYPNQHHMHFLQTSLSRAIVCLVVNYLIMWYNKGTISFKDRKTQFMATYRSLTNTLQGMFVALLMYYLPMPIIHTISSSSSIFTAMIEHYFYGVHLSNRSKVLILVSIFGVMLQANGEYITRWLWGNGDTQRKSLFQNYEHVTALQCLVISFVFLCYVCAWSYGLVIVKHIKLAFYELNFHNNVVLIIVTGLLYFMVPNQKKSSLQTLCSSLLFSGTSVLFAQLTFVIALMICKSVGMMMVLNTTNILIAYLYSLIRYQETIDLFSLCGMIITLTCIFMVISDRYQ